MRRSKLLVVLAALAALVAAGMGVLWPLGDRISLANYEHIHEGMTLAEVEAILGRPGDYATGPTTSARYSSFGVGIVVGRECSWDDRFCRRVRDYDL